MFGLKETVATIPVKDLAKASRFYEEKLGLTKGRTEGEEAVAYRSGSSGVLVYRSQFAGTNKATAATLVVDDVEKAVETLKSKGISFEHYDMPGMTRKGDVHLGGNTKVAWFKDPDGNILSLVDH
ncbi:MAG TPA: VOC family protein [Thermoanaerobaculia bacterium]|jgi:predicted enzyme related to lactoylglutathione lyase